MQRPGEVASSAAVECQVLKEVQGVDRRAHRAVEARRVEGDGLVVALGCDVDDAAMRGDVLNGKAECPASYSVDDQVEVAVMVSTTSAAPRRPRSSCEASASRTSAVTWAPLARAS